MQRSFCAPCAATLEIPGDACPRCAGVVGAGRGCQDCRRLGEPSFALLRSACSYGGAIAAALQRLKWQHRDDLAAPLATLLVDPLRDAATRCDLLVPVPLHGARLRQRGYNQSALLLRAAARAAGVRTPQGLLALARVRDDGPQRGADPRARARAAAGAFRAAPLVSGRRVLLIDDVATSLATADGCAAALRAAGAARVEVLTLARAAS